MVSHVRTGANAKIRELNIEQNQVVCLDSKIFLQNDSQKRVTRGESLEFPNPINWQDL